uniref:C-type lectin domain-containing protein n=1 Tax=Poecilia reticulata TaxID=8081 RepID=A0A3P9NBK0_POERE
ACMFPHFKLLLTSCSDLRANWTASPAELDCPAGWSWFDHRCFVFVPYQMTWAAAEKYCLSLDGHLASYHNIAEYNFIRELVLRVSGKHTSSWVGGYDAPQEGTWLWSDGSKFIFTNWHGGEPSNGENEDCMDINAYGIYYWQYTIYLIILFKYMFL